MQKQVIMIFGAPGAGKGTQAELLSDKLNMQVVEPSKILERKFKEIENLEGQEKSETLKELENWKTGKLCSPPYVSKLVLEEIKNLFKADKSIILAGSPRTLFEVEKELPVLIDLYKQENLKSFLLEIRPEETVFRNSHRKICELMRHPILFNDETKNLSVCPLDGSKLMKREDLDDPETIKVRIEEYKDRTFPVIDYLEKNGIKVQKINGEQPIADVHKDILKALNQ